MAEKQGDLLMKFVQSNGDIVKGGATSVLRKDDKLLFDFWAGKFIEIDEFEFGLNVEDSEIVSEADARKGAGTELTGQRQKFAAWRRKDAGLIGYPVVAEPFSFTRVMDRASPIFFQNCCNSISFDSATLVKRKVTGASLALQSFLRLDFSNVLIVGLNWNDGQVLKETCKFICRGITVQYKQQASDGTLGAARSAEWTRDMTTRTA